MIKRSLFISIMLTVLATSAATISSVLNQPTFDLEHSTNETTVFEANTAYLRCRVKNLGQKKVSWIRKDNLNILTIGRYSFSLDDRISSFTNEASTEWVLKIRYVRERDAGLYSCQISTDPPVEHDVHLKVTVSQASIVGSKELYIRSGDSLNLTCIINHKRRFIFWYRDRMMINYNKTSLPQAIIEARSLNDSYTSFQLFIPVTSIHDSGNYSCHAGSAIKPSVQVYVIQSEAPSTENDYTENYDGTDDGSEGYFSYFVDAVCYYTSMFCRE